MNREYSLHPDKITVLKHQTLLKACETLDSILVLHIMIVAHFREMKAGRLFEGWALIR